MTDRERVEAFLVIPTPCVHQAENCLCEAPRMVVLEAMVRAALTTRNTAVIRKLAACLPREEKP